MAPNLALGPESAAISVPADSHLPRFKRRLTEPAAASSTLSPLPSPELNRLPLSDSSQKRKGATSIMADRGIRQDPFVKLEPPQPNENLPSQDNSEQSSPVEPRPSAPFWGLPKPAVPVTEVPPLAGDQEQTTEGNPERLPAGSHQAVTGLGAILGPSFNDYPVTSEVVVEALRYKIEQERSRQEYWRLESRRKAIDLFNLAVRNGVPNATIHYLFASTEDAKPPYFPPVLVNPTPSGPAGSVDASGRSPSRSDNEEQRSPIRSGPAASIIPPARSQAGSSANRQKAARSPPPSIQFHHWKPTPAKDKTSPRHEPEKRKSLASDLHTPGSVETPQHAHTASAPSSAQLPNVSPAAVIAAQNARRRTMGHARHRSEASVGRNPWYGSRPDEGMAILANLASERNQTQEFMLEQQRQAWGGPMMVPRVPMGQMMAPGGSQASSGGPGGPSAHISAAGAQVPNMQGSPGTSAINVPYQSPQGPQGTQMSGVSQRNVNPFRASSPSRNKDGRPSKRQSHT